METLLEVKELDEGLLDIIYEAVQSFVEREIEVEEEVEELPDFLDLELETADNPDSSDETADSELPESEDEVKDQSEEEEKVNSSDENTGDDELNPSPVEETAEKGETAAKSVN